MAPITNEIVRERAFSWDNTCIETETTLLFDESLLDHHIFQPDATKRKLNPTSVQRQQIKKENDKSCNKNRKISGTQILPDFTKFPYRQDPTTSSVVSSVLASLPNFIPPAMPSSQNCDSQNVKSLVYKIEHELPSTCLPGMDPPLSSSYLHKPDGIIGSYTKEQRQARIDRFRAKKKRRVWKKIIKYDCRKRLADTRPRKKGRFVSRKDTSCPDGGGEGEDESDHLSEENNSSAQSNEGGDDLITLGHFLHDDSYSDP